MCKERIFAHMPFKLVSIKGQTHSTKVGHMRNRGNVCVVFSNNAHTRLWTLDQRERERERKRKRKRRRGRELDVNKTFVSCM